MDERDEMRRYRYTADWGVKNPVSGLRANRPYSAASYAAQYGIGVEDAQDILELLGGPDHCTHAEVEREIGLMRGDR